MSSHWDAFLYILFPLDTPLTTIRNLYIIFMNISSFMIMLIYNSYNNENNYSNNYYY